MLAALATIGVVLAVTITAHELAHLLVARAVGHTVFEIQIGGGVIWTRRFGDVDVRLGPFPIGGHVQTGARDFAGYRWKAALVALAGVGANAVLVVVGIWFFPPLIALNVLAIAVNLWPGRQRKMGEPSSDGRAALDLTRGDVDAIAEERSAWFSVQALRARDARDLDRARSIIEDGVAELGETRALLAVQGVIAFEQQRFEDVVHSYAPLIDDNRVTVLGRAGFAADAAWSASLSTDPELRRLALPWAQLGVGVRPKDAHRRCALALAQFDAGEFDAAAQSLVGCDGAVPAAIRSMIGWALGDRSSDVTAAVLGGLAADHPLSRRVREVRDPHS